MSRRTWNPVSFHTSAGMIHCYFGFISTLIGTNPVLATTFGMGGLTGPDAAGNGVANSGPSAVASITKTANNGEFLVTLADGYRAVWMADATVWGPVAGPNDGVQAAVSLPANQGSGHTTPITFLVTMLNAAGAPTETNGRTVCIDLVLKDSIAGS
jgi:hypothetical protein